VNGLPMGKVCKECNKIIREYSRKVYVPSSKRKNPKESYVTIYTPPKGKHMWAILTYCSDACYKRWKERYNSLRKEWRNKRQRLRKLVIERQNGKCAVSTCNRPIKDVHHIKSIWARGENSIENLIGLCKHHHVKHHTLKGF